VSASRLRHGLLVPQIALTTVLLYVAGLTAHSYARAATLDYGFDAENVLVFRPNLALNGTTPQAVTDQFNQLQQRLLDSTDDLRASPLVTAAGTFGAAPFADQVTVARGAMSSEPRTFQEIVALDGRPIDPMRVRVENVDEDFIATLGATLEAGRPFDRQGDRAAVIVNETAARRIQSPVLGTALGRTIQLGNASVRVVGVVKDLVDTRPNVPPDPQVFLHRGGAFAGGVLIARVKPPMEAALPVVRGVLERRWGRLAPTRVHPMADDLDDVLTPWRARSIVLNMIAAFCLPLAIIGVAGALTYAVRARTREHAIRLALGAEPARVRHSVIRQAMTLVAAGLGIGLFGGMAAGRVMASVLFDVRPIDLLTVAAVVAGVCVLTWLAAIGPAKRAANVAPAEALREA
jgi:putative ABC transport system permease protein